MNNLRKHKYGVILVLALPLMSGLAMAGLFGSEPEHPAFRVDHADSEVAYKIKVKGENGWVRGFSADIQLMFDPKNPEERAHVGTIAHSFNPPQGIEDYKQNSLRLSLSVFRIIDGNEQLTYSKDIDKENNDGYGKDNYELVVDTVPLPAGEYIFRLKTLEDNPSLTGIPARFFVGSRWK